MMKTASAQGQVSRCVFLCRQATSGRGPVGGRPLRRPRKRFARFRSGCWPRCFGRCARVGRCAPRMCGPIVGWVEREETSRKTQAPNARNPSAAGGYQSDRCQMGYARCCPGDLATDTARFTHPTKSWSVVNRGDHLHPSERFALRHGVEGGPSDQQHAHHHQRQQRDVDACVQAVGNAGNQRGCQTDARQRAQRQHRESQQIDIADDPRRQRGG